MLIVKLAGWYNVRVTPYDPRISFKSHLSFEIELQEQMAREYLFQRMVGLFPHETPVLQQLFVLQATEVFSNELRKNRELYNQYRRKDWRVEANRLFLFDTEDHRQELDVLVDCCKDTKLLSYNRRDMRTLIFEHYPHLKEVKQND